MTDAEAVGRALSVRRLLSKSALGVVSRGAQGALLGVAVLSVSSQDGSDVALVLGVATTLNLVTNVGIPTLIIRGFRQGASSPYLFALARSYILMSVLAGMASGGVIWAFTGSLSLSIVAGGLALFQSLYYGIEFWVLGDSNQRYDRFLRTGALAQAGFSLFSPVVLLCFKDVELALAALVASFVLGAVVFLLVAGLNIRAVLGLNLMAPLWWRDALALALVTALTGLLYSVDIFVVRILASGELADYRLAMYGITFLVALLPLNLFVLADASQ